MGDHSTPQQGGPTPSKQTECGLTAGDVGAPIFTTDKENMTTKDIRLTSNTKDNARACRGSVVTSQSIQMTDRNIDKPLHSDSKITAPVVSQTQQTPHGQQGKGSRLSCADAGGRAALIQDDYYDRLTPYQGAQTEEDIYYNPRPSALPLGLMPRTPYALGSSGCHQRETAEAEKNNKQTSNNQSQQGANLLGRSSSLVASSTSVGKETQADITAAYDTFFGPVGPTFTHPPTSQSIVFGDPSRSAGLMKSQFHQSRPNLFEGTSPTSVQPALSVGGQTALAAANTRPKESASLHRERVSTTLRDKRLAEYEARLNRLSNQNAGVKKQVDKADGTTIIGGPDADYRYDTRRAVSAQPMFRDSRVTASVLDQEDGSWVRHQLRAKQITNNENRQTERARDHEKGPTHIGPYAYAPVSGHERPRDPTQPLYDARLAEDSVDEEPQPNSPVRQRFHAIPIARGERMSRRDRYDGLDRANPEFFPQPAREYAPLEPADRMMPNRPVPIARLAKMDVFKVEGNDQLDTFFDQVEEFAAFFHWDERETCRQARAHLRGTALAYVKRARFPPRSWDELKALLLKRFQPRDLTATYKAQFRSRRRRRQTEDTYAFVEALQKLADMAWPFMDQYAKEELIVDQLLMGMDSHELNVQVAAHGHRRVDDVLRVARSLEAVREEEKQYFRGRKPTPQARFVTDERTRSSDTDEPVKEVLAQPKRDKHERRDTRSRPQHLAPRGSEAPNERTQKTPFVHHREITRETDQPPMTDGPEAGKVRLSATVAKATDTLPEIVPLKDIIE